MMIKTSFIVRAALAVLILTPLSAYAQEPRTGLVLGTSGASFIWAFSERVAVRPELGFSTAHSSGGSAINPTQSESLQLTPAFSALFYLKKIEGLRTYFSPRYSYQRLTGSVTSALQGTSNSRSTQHATAGSFGAEYSVQRHFGVFGEIGVGYTKTASGWSLGNRAGLGAILYF